MAISLAKGQKISLTKDNAGLTSIKVGLGWDQVKKSSGGLFGGLFGGSGGSGADIDIDASVFMLVEGDKIKKDNIVYFNKELSNCGSIRHMGDNRTGAGDGDDEVITVDLNRIPQEIKKLVFVVNIFKATDRGQDFGQIENAFIRVMDNSNGRELVRYDLSDSYKSMKSVVVSELYRDGNEWKFSAVGNGYDIDGLMSLARLYQ